MSGEKGGVKRKTEKLGLVLEGGGAKGAYHLGALRLLRERGYKFDGVAGTSIGALNGAMFVSDGNLSSMTRFWKNAKTSTLLDFNDDLAEQYFKKERPIDRNLISHITKILPLIGEENEALSERMRSYLHGFINEEKIRKSKKDFGLVTYSVSDFKGVEIMKEDMPEGTVADFVTASANYPIFKFYEINGKKYVDGGLWDNLPINLLARNGYKKMVVIRTGTGKPKRKLQFDDLDLMYIVPSEKLNMAMAFTEENVQYYIELGYNDAMRTVDGLKGANFYIKSDNEEDAERFILGLPDSFFVGIIYALKKTPQREKEENYFYIASVIRDELDLPKDTDATDAFLHMFEQFAEIAELEKFKHYFYADFVTETSRAFGQYIFDRESFFKRCNRVKSDELREIFFAFIMYFYDAEKSSAESENAQKPQICKKK